MTTTNNIIDKLNYIFTQNDFNFAKAEKLVKKVELTDELKEFLIKNSKTNNLDIKHFILEKLYSFTGERIHHLALKALQDSEAIIQLGAIDILGKEKATRNIPVLVKKLSSSDELIRCYAAESLGDIVEPTIVSILIKQLKKEKSPIALSGLYYALIIQGQNDYLSSLINLLHSKSHIVIIRVLDSLECLIDENNKSKILSEVNQLEQKQLPLSVIEKLKEFKQVI